MADLVPNDKPVIGRVTPDMVVKGLVVKQSFCASHQLKDYDGECSRLHGHTWSVEATFHYLERRMMTPYDTESQWYPNIMGDELAGACMAVDFKKLKNLVAHVLPDHQHLNDVYASDNVTAEYLSNVIFSDIQRTIVDLFGTRIWLAKLMVWESENAGAFVEIQKGKEF